MPTEIYCVGPPRSIVTDHYLLDHCICLSSRLASIIGYSLTERWWSC